MTTLPLSDSGSGSTPSGMYVNSTVRPVQSFPFDIARHYLLVVGLPCIILFGIFGNIMIIIIMKRTASDESGIHIYFTAMAVSDMICLCVAPLTEWMMELFSLYIIDMHTAVCKIFNWLYPLGNKISVWSLVCMTVHRAMSVVWPHRVNVLCTRRTVLLLVSGIIVFFSLFCLPYLYAVDIVYDANSYTYNTCALKTSFVYFMENIFFYIDLSFYCFLPFTFLAVSNSILIWKLSVAVKSVNRMMTPGDTGKIQSHEKAANSVTLTVILVSLTFIALTVPLSINIIVNYFDVSEYDMAKRFLINDVCYIIGYTNNAVNFYLYCLTGRRFREESLKVLCCGRNN